MTDLQLREVSLVFVTLCHLPPSVFFPQIRSKPDFDLVALKKVVVGPEDELFEGAPLPSPVSWLLLSVLAIEGETEAHVMWLP